MQLYLYTLVVSPAHENSGMNCSRIFSGALYSPKNQQIIYYFTGIVGGGYRQLYQTLTFL